MSLDISLKLADVSDISTGRLLSGFEDEQGKLHDGCIKSNGNYYNVKFLEGGTAEVRRNYQGPFSWFRNRWCSHETTRAKALQEKINTILSQSDSNEYRILSGTHTKLLNLVRTSKEKTIEVANYGFETNRTTLDKGQIVIELNRKLKAEGRSIRFNKIDDYNALVGINPRTVDPRSMNTLMTGIKKVTLMPRVRGGYKDNFKMSDLKEWQKFLQTNAQKIDIPAKLYSYMHLLEGHKAGKQTGWEASFAKDKTAAMRSFILKNIPYACKEHVSTPVVDLLADKMKSYVEIYAIEDEKKRDEAYGEFFRSSNWLMPKEQKSFNDFAAKYGKEHASKFADESKSLDERQLFNLFRNVLSYAFFRQTSKLGLEFFRDKGTPVMFQFADYAGQSYKNREMDLFKPEGWRKGENSEDFSKDGGAPITNSELRRAMKINSADSLNRDVNNINAEEPNPNIIMV